MPINYQVLGLLLNKQRPYGTDADTRLTVDLSNPAIYRPQLPGAVTDRDNRNYVDCFGPLAANNAVDPFPVRVETKPDGVRAIPEVEKAIELKWPNGNVYQITKGLRIPYSYKSETGEDVYANVFVLFNGSGQL